MWFQQQSGQIVLLISKSSLENCYKIYCINLSSRAWIHWRVPFLDTCASYSQKVVNRDTDQSNEFLQWTVSRWWEALPTTQHVPAGFSTSMRRVRSTTAKVVDVTNLGNMGHKHQPALIWEIKGTCLRTQNSCLTVLSKVKAKCKRYNHYIPYISTQEIVLERCSQSTSGNTYLPFFSPVWFSVLLHAANVYSQHWREF